MGRNRRIRIRTWTMMRGGGYEEVDWENEKSNIFGFNGTDSSGGVPETREIVHSCRGSQRLVSGSIWDKEYVDTQMQKFIFLYSLVFANRGKKREQCLNK